MAGPPPTYHCLTFAPGLGLLREIQSPFGVCAGFDPEVTPLDQRPPFAQFNAIWDTGATNSAVSQKVVDACGLKPIGMAQVDGAHGRELRPVFLVNIQIYQGPMVYNVRVTLADLVGGADALIGMDIITFGDFSITNKDGQTVFSFRIPSGHVVDFVKEARRGQKPGQPLFTHGGGKHNKKRKRRK